jgi:hypothetical protein
MRSRRLAPQFFASMPYSISASVISERFEDKARRKKHLIRSSLRVVGSLWHLDSSLAHQAAWA